MNIKELKRKLTRTPELDSTFPIHQYVYIYIVHIFTFYFVVLNLHIWVPDVYSMGYKQKSVFIPFSSSLLGRLGVCPPNKLSQVIFLSPFATVYIFSQTRSRGGSAGGLTKALYNKDPICDMNTSVCGTKFSLCRGHAFDVITTIMWDTHSVLG